MDKNDDSIIACALTYDGIYIVTSDQDLLIIRKYGGIKVIGSREYELLLD